MAFTVGSVVELASGGPLMVVKELHAAGGTLVCHWFEDTGVPLNCVFAEASLVKRDVHERKRPEAHTAPLPPEPPAPVPVPIPPVEHSQPQPSGPAPAPRLHRDDQGVMEE